MRDQLGMLHAAIRCSSTSKLKPLMLCPASTSGSRAVIRDSTKVSNARSLPTTTTLRSSWCFFNCRPMSNGMVTPRPGLRMQEKWDSWPRLLGVAPSMLTPLWMRQLIPTTSCL